MSKFKVGDLVWHGWVPDSDVYGFDDVLDRRFMQGEIVDGPIQHPDYGTPSWGVVWSDGIKVYAREVLLIKIPPEEEHGRKTKSKDKERPETV